MIHSLYESNHLDLFHDIINNVMTINFNWALKNFKAEDLLKDFIYLLINNVNAKKKYSIYLIDFIFQVMGIVYINQNNIVQILLGNNECEKINLYLYEFNAQKVLDIYKKILYLTIDSEQIPLNPIVLKAISNFYKLKQVCSETKFEILSYICEQSKIF